MHPSHESTFAHMVHTSTPIDFSIAAMRQWFKLPEGTRAEVINGKLYLLAEPKPNHCRVSMRIMFELMRHVDEYSLGEVMHESGGVFLKNATNAVVPYISFISNNNPLIVDEKGYFGAPDLIIEVLSPSTAKRDRTIKKSLYEESGVKEYWIVDPESKNARGYLLKDGKYGEPMLTNATIHIRILDKLIAF